MEGKLTRDFSFWCSEVKLSAHTLIAWPIAYKISPNQHQQWKAWLHCFNMTQSPRCWLLPWSSIRWTTTRSMQHVALANVVGNSPWSWEMLVKWTGCQAKDLSSVCSFCCIVLGIVFLMERIVQYTSFKKNWLSTPFSHFKVLGTCVFENKSLSPWLWPTPFVKRLFRLRLVQFLKIPCVVVWGPTLNSCSNRCLVHETFPVKWLQWQNATAVIKISLVRPSLSHLWMWQDQPRIKSTACRSARWEETKGQPLQWGE